MARPQRRTARSSRQQPMPSPSAEENDSNDGPSDTESESETVGVDAPDTETNAQYLSGKYISKAGNSTQLVKRLQDVRGALQRQAASTSASFTSVLKELLAPAICNNKNKVVQALAACCISEMMRITSPASPFATSDELEESFQVLCEVFSSISDASTSKKKDPRSKEYAVEALEQCSASKGYLLILQVDDSDDNDVPMLTQFFQSLLEGVDDSSQEHLVVSILSQCLEKMEKPDQSLLDALLQPLAQDDAKDSTSYAVVSQVIKSCSHVLQYHIPDYLNRMLPGHASNLLVDKPSALQDHVYALILSLQQVDPLQVTRVLPSVFHQLQIDNLKIRSDAVAFLGKFFALDCVDTSSAYKQDLHAFMERFRDVSKDIRKQMIEIGAQLWQSKPDVANVVESQIMERLSDRDWDVRRLAVTEVCDVAVADLSLVSAKCLEEVGERMRDKKVVTRKETMTGLSQCFRVHITNYIEEDTDLSDMNKSVPRDHAEKLAWVPSYVLQCFSYDNQELQLRVVQLLDDILLPKAFADTRRAKILVYMFMQLEDKAQEGLRRVLHQRSKSFSAIRSFCLARQIKDEDQTRVLSKAVSSLHSVLSVVLKETPDLSSLVTQLAKHKDKAVFKHLDSVVDASHTSQELRKARDDLITAVGSKSALGQLLRDVCRQTSTLTLTQQGLEVLLEHLETSQVASGKMNVAIGKLIEMHVKYIPQLLSPFVSEQFPKLVTCGMNGQGLSVSDSDDSEEESGQDRRVIRSLLRALSEFAAFYRKLPANEELELSASLSSALRHCVLGQHHVSSSRKLAHAKDEQVVKLAAKTFANLATREEVDRMAHDLTAPSRLKSGDATTVQTALLALRIMAKHGAASALASTSILENVWQTLYHGIILSASEESEEDAKRRCLALQAATNLLLYAAPDDDERGKELVRVLFDALQSERKWYKKKQWRTEVRAAAGSSALKVARNSHLERHVSVELWHLLASLVQDDSVIVRRQMAKTLKGSVLRPSLSHKYVSLLVLSACEKEEDIQRTFIEALELAVDKLRHLNKEYVASGRSAGLTSALTPEFALPYVLHLLSHSSSFPTSILQSYDAYEEEMLQEDEWKSVLVYLRFYFQHIRCNGENVPLLLQILQKLKKYRDAVDDDRKRLLLLIGSAETMLRKSVKPTQALTPFPGKVYLPSSLFTLVDESPEKPKAKQVTPSKPTTQQTLMKSSLSPIQRTEPGGSNDFMLKPTPPVFKKKTNSVTKSSASSTSSKRKRESKAKPSKKQKKDEPVAERRLTSRQRKLLEKD